MKQIFSWMNRIPFRQSLCWQANDWYFARPSLHLLGVPPPSGRHTRLQRNPLPWKIICIAGETTALDSECEILDCSSVTRCSIPIPMCQFREDQIAPIEIRCHHEDILAVVQSTSRMMRRRRFCIAIDQRLLQQASDDLFMRAAGL